MESQHNKLPEEFDFFLYAQVWRPRFCCNNLKQCTKQKWINITGLDYHGLWPSYFKKQGYPSYCVNQHEMIFQGRVAHEWLKHGACSQFSPASYLKHLVELGESNRQLRQTNLMLIDASSKTTSQGGGGTVTVSSIYKTMGGERNVAIMSNKFCVLQELTSCFEKQLVDKDGHMLLVQMECPESVLKSNRNSAVVQFKCNELFVEAGNNGEEEKCKFISKELLKKLKGVKNNI